MRYLIGLFVILFSFHLFADEGGVGGFVGRQTGSILFQLHSLNVNPLTNDTLCLNRNDEYQAMVGPFYSKDDRNREVRVDRFQAFQPRVSLQEDCSNWRDPGGDRTRYCRRADRVWVPFVQERYRTVPVMGEVGVDYYQDVTIPRCR